MSSRYKNDSKALSIAVEPKLSFSTCSPTLDSDAALPLTLFTSLTGPTRNLCFCKCLYLAFFQVPLISLLSFLLCALVVSSTPPTGQASLMIPNLCLFCPAPPPPTQSSGEPPSTQQLLPQTFPPASQLHVSAARLYVPLPLASLVFPRSAAQYLWAGGGGAEGVRRRNRIEETRFCQPPA